MRFSPKAIPRLYFYNIVILLFFVFPSYNVLAHTNFLDTPREEKNNTFLLDAQKYAFWGTILNNQNQLIGEEENNDEGGGNRRSPRSESSLIKEPKINYHIIPSDKYSLLITLSQNSRISDANIRAAYREIMSYLISPRNNEELRNLLTRGQTNIDLVIDQNFAFDMETTLIIYKMLKLNLIRTLSISNYAVGDNEVILLAEALEENTSLVLLALHLCQIKSEGTKALAKALERNSHIETLDLAGNEIGLEGIQAIANMLLINKSLLNLILKYCWLRQDGTKLIAKALEKNTTLITLDISINGIEDEGALAIAAMLEKNRSLLELYLIENAIDSTGTTAIFIALTENDSLTTLDISESNIGPGGPTIVASMIEINTALIDLRMRYVNINDSGAILIEEAIENNPRFLYLDLGYACINTEIRERIERQLVFHRTALADVFNFAGLTEERYHELINAEYDLEEEQMEILQAILTIVGIEFYINRENDANNIAQALEDAEDNFLRLVNLTGSNTYLLFALERMLHIHLAAARIFKNNDPGQYLELSRRALLFQMLIYGVKLKNKNASRNDRVRFLSFISEHLIPSNDNKLNGGLKKRGILEEMDEKNIAGIEASFNLTLDKIIEENSWVLMNNKLLLLLDRCFINLFLKNAV